MEALRFNRLIERIKLFDEGSFNEIYDEYSRLVLWIALKITMNESDAHDIHSLVMTDIWNNARSYKYIDKPDDWISEITRNKAINYFNKNIKLQSHDVEFRSLSDDDTLRLLSIENDISEIEFDSLISCLNDKERHIIKLKIFYKFTQEEIAKELKMSPGTVAWRFNNALKKLRKKLPEKNIC